MIFSLFTFKFKLLQTWLFITLCGLLLSKCDIYHPFTFFLPPISGKNPVNKPIKGKNAQTLNTYCMLVLSANAPSNAEPIPPIPKAKPKNNPAISPTLPGINSCP